MKIRLAIAALLLCVGSHGFAKGWSVGNCIGVSGDPFGPGYAAPYTTFGSTTAISLYIVGSQVFASVMLDNGRWYEGTTFLGTGGPLGLTVQRDLSIPMFGPTGGGELVLCATHTLSSGKLTSSMIVNGGPDIGPLVFDKLL